MFGKMDMSPIGGLTSLLPMAIGLGKVCIKSYPKRASFGVIATDTKWVTH